METIGRVSGCRVDAAPLHPVAEAANMLPPRSVPKRSGPSSRLHLQWYALSVLATPDLDPWRSS